MSKEKISLVLHWLPRILIVLFVLFISLFSLDVFFEGYSFLETVVALFMHLIPTFVLIGVVAVTWKNSRVGGILFVLMAAGFTFFFRTYRSIEAFLLLSFPLLIIASLFFIDDFMKKKSNRKDK